MSSEEDAPVLDDDELEDGTSSSEGDHGDDDHDDEEDHDDDDHDDDDDDDDGDPPCFTRGTTMRTKHGGVLVEELAIGDLLWTEAHGYQPIRWICRRKVSAQGEFAPIRIRAGALGADHDILVSPAHRMLVQGPEVELLFGMPKALIAAKDLVNDTTILRETGLKTVEYFHILFDQHEVLEAHGTLSESFFPDSVTVDDFGSEQRKELFALFPELENGAQGYVNAYPNLMACEVVLLGR